MLWGPENWDAIQRRTGTDTSPHPLPDRSLRTTLKRLPGRTRMTLADLGCGTGRWLPFLVRHFAQVVAIDYAPASLALARRVANGHDVVFRRRDLRDLTPFRNTFDIALAVDSIVGPRHADIDRVLEQVRLSLREGGIFLGTFPAAPREGDPVPLVLGDGPEAPEPIQLHEVELQYRLRRVGFQGVRIERFPFDRPASGVLLATATRRANN
jgi:SAM-dependent methyltransferase